MMPYSYVRYSADGTQTTFPIVFDGGPPLRPSHVKVYVDGALKALTTDYVLDASTTEVQFNAAPSAGEDNVVVLRSTPDTAATRTVSFRPGSIITARDLDESTIASIYVAQEVADRFAIQIDPATGGIVGFVAFDFGSIS